MDAVLVQSLGAGAGQPHRKAQGPEQVVPEREAVPEFQHARDADGGLAVGQHRDAGPVAEQQLLAVFEEVGHGVDALAGGLDLLADGAVGGLPQDLAALAAVSGDEIVAG